MEEGESRKERKKKEWIKIKTKWEEKREIEQINYRKERKKVIWQREAEWKLKKKRERQINDRKKRFSKIARVT